MKKSDIKITVGLDENNVPEKVEKITFIIPGMPLYSGGHTSILRLGTELSKNGYDVRYFSIYDNESLEEMKNNAKALEREARKRNCRLWAIIICLVVSALIYIIVPLATSS